MATAGLRRSIRATQLPLKLKEQKSPTGEGKHNKLSKVTQSKIENKLKEIRGQDERKTVDNRGIKKGKNDKGNNTSKSGLEGGGAETYQNDVNKADFIEGVDSVNLLHSTCNTSGGESNPNPCDAN